MSTKQRTLHDKLLELHQTQFKLETKKNEFDNEVKFINKSITLHNENIKKLECKNFGQRCEHCGAEVTKENVQQFINEEQVQIENLTKTIPVPLLDFKKLIENTYAEEADLIDQLNTINIAMGDLDVKIKETQKQKDVILLSVGQANSRRDSLNMIIKDLNIRKQRIENQLQEINISDKLKQLNDLKDMRLKLEALTSTNSGLILEQSNKLVIYEFWKSSFSNKGIRPLLLDKFCFNFNKIIKPICQSISGGKFNIEFTPTSTTRAGQERNKLGLKIIYKDKSVLYEGLSGGEKTRCNLPLCFGLNKFITQQYGLKGSLLGIIILDEVFANLDHDGEEDVAAFLFTESKDKFIGVITHSDELQSFSNDVWKITKKDDVTHLEVL